MSANIEAKLDSANNRDRKSTRLNSSHSQISYAVLCLQKKYSTNLSFIHPKSFTLSVLSRVKASSQEFRSNLCLCSVPYSIPYLVCLRCIKNDICRMMH